MTQLGVTELRKVSNISLGVKPILSPISSDCTYCWSNGGCLGKICYGNWIGGPYIHLYSLCFLHNFHKNKIEKTTKRDCSWIKQASHLVRSRGEINDWAYACDKRVFPRNITVTRNIVCHEMQLFF